MWLPKHDLADFFDTFHMVTDRVYAAKYGPGTAMFYVPGVCADEDYTLDIFDRWGSKVFNSVSRNHGWNGKTDHGQDAPDGTYFFVIKIKDSAYKGFLQLVR